jgi:hypothetical protein
MRSLISPAGILLFVSIFAAQLTACSGSSNTSLLPNVGPTTPSNSMAHAKKPSYTQDNCSNNPQSCAGCNTDPNSAACGDNGSPGTGGTGNGVNDGGSTGDQVAVYSSPPADGQKCGNNPGSGYGYHDNLPYQRNGVPAQVTNINEVIQAQGMPYNAGGQLMVQDTLVGWFYEDQWGYYYFQSNPNLGWYPSVGISYANSSGFGVSFGLTAAPNTTAQQLMSNGSPVAGIAHLPAGKAVAQCWTRLKAMTS